MNSRFFSFSGTGQFLASQDDEFLENNCVDDPVRLCDFQLLENRIMKTVDSVYQVSENGFTEKCLICYKYYFLDILIILGVTVWKTCEKLDFSSLLSTKKKNLKCLRVCTYFHFHVIFSGCTYNGGLSGSLLNRPL